MLQRTTKDVIIMVLEKEIQTMARTKTLKGEYKKLYRRTMKLKEGGKAWERNMEILEVMMAELRRRHEKEWKNKYNY